MPLHALLLSIRIGCIRQGPSLPLHLFISCWHLFSKQLRIVFVSTPVKVDICSLYAFFIPFDTGSIRGCYCAPVQVQRGVLRGFCGWVCVIGIYHIRTNPEVAAGWLVSGLCVSGARKKAREDGEREKERDKRSSYPVDRLSRES